MDIATQPAPISRFLWDADRYEEAVARGIFTPDDPIELIDGEIITHMSPQYSPHATAVSLVAAILRTVYASGYFVREQQPLRVGHDSVPEPDVAVVRGAVRDYAKSHPSTAELIVEVADSSLEFDRGRKLRLYARNRIPDYWVVNLVDRWVEVYRQPTVETYRDTATLRAGDHIRLNEHTIPVVDLLP